MGITIQSLVKEYTDVRAVDGIDLTVDGGEVFGLLGPNGAGKSTTINVILDFVRPTSGSVSVFGHDPQEEPREVREHLGVLPEANGFYGRDTAIEHVEFAAEMSGSDTDPEELLDRVGIADSADRVVGGFSKGMRQRLGLAIALVDEPDVLILDEPLGGLDPTGAKALRRIVRQERDRGAAILFSSHIMDQVEILCDRIGIMNEGELVKVGTVEEVRAGADTPTTLTVTLDRVTEAVRKDLLGIDGVSTVELREGEFVIECTTETAKSGAISLLDDSEGTISDIDIATPSIEQVFMQLAAGSST